jgi:putative peptidoglycan lipid II flippase
MLRDTAMLAAFGVSIQTDAYRLAITIPDTLFMLVAGGGLSSAFIPVFSELLHTKREREAWKLFSVVITVCSLAVTALIAVAWFLAPWIAYLMTRNKTNKAGENISALLHPHVVEMGRILLPAQFAFLIGSVLLGTLYSRRQFLAPGLAPNVYNVGIIAGAIVGGMTPLGIAGMPWGGLIGAMIGNLLLPALFMARGGSHFRPSLDLKAEGVKKFFKLLAPVIFGFSLPSVVQLITNFYAANYSEGINTVLGLGNTLMQAPSGIFGQSLALAAFPVLAQFFANQRMDLYRDQITRTLRTVIYLGLPASALMFALAPEIVHLLYAYGKASADTDLGQVALALRTYSFSVFAWCLQPVLMRGFFSIHKTFVPVALSTGLTALFIILCELSVRAHLPYLALAWFTNVCAILLVIVLYIGLEKAVGALDRKGLLATLLKSLAGSVAMGAAAYGAAFVARQVGASNHRLGEFAIFLVVATCAAWIYYFVTRSLKMPETDYFDRALAKLNRRRA